MPTTTITRTTRTQTESSQQSVPDDGRYRLDFGQHRGLTLDEAPAAWVRWVVRERVYERRPALRAALAESGWLRSGESGSGAQAGGRAAGGGRTAQAGACARAKGNKTTSTAFAGSGNVLGGTPADR